MSQALVGRYWCYECNQVVSQLVDAELKCPHCDGGFLEEMESRGDTDSTPELGSDQPLSLWAPILLEMMGGSSRRSRFRREEEDDDSDLDHEFENFLRRQRRTSAIFQLLQSLQNDVRFDSSSFEIERERRRERRRGREVFVNPSVFFQGSSDNDENQSQNSNNSSSMSLGDYFIGPGLDMLLQHLAENDPNRYGTPPAKKEAVDALPTVKIEETIGCSVCLDDFTIGTQAKEMPCKHKFHGDCILPWLELHSSCPVCRFQLPADESKISNGSNIGSRADSNDAENVDGDDRGDGSRFWVPVPWPFSGLFSSPGSENSGNSSSNPSSSNSRNNSQREGQ